MILFDGGETIVFAAWKTVAI